MTIPLSPPSHAPRSVRARFPPTLWLAIGAAALHMACAEVEPQGTPEVQASAGKNARWTVNLGRVRNGISRTYNPRCMDRVKPGDTVEFRNYNPTLSANVTALAAPEGVQPLYSPNLTAPYNYVDPEDGDAYSYWRYTFVQPGVYDWIDTHSSEPGRKVVDVYYGTVTFVGIDPDSPFGTICVPDEDGTGCDSVCCGDDSDCSSGQRCFRTEVDTEGRCLTPSG